MKFIANRHIVKDGAVVKPGQEIEFTKKQAEGHLNAGWISEPEASNDEAPKNDAPKEETKSTTKKGDDSDK